MDLSLLAVLHEINGREFKRRLRLYPEDLRLYVIAAGAIVGLENSRKLQETPKAVIDDAESFVGKLLGLIGPSPGESFAETLGSYLLDTLRDELKSSCLNCRNFTTCLDIPNLRVGSLFQRRIDGDETDSLRRAIKEQVEEALLKTPYAERDDAGTSCPGFSHQYNASNIGILFSRYAGIAAVLQEKFGINKRKVLEEMVTLNMSFCSRAGDPPPGDS